MEDIIQSMSKMTMEGYEMKEKIGGGRFSSVWKALKSDGTPVAIKRYKRQDESYANNEILMLSNLICPYIIRYIGAFENKGRIHIVTELAGENIQDLIRYFRKEHKSVIPLNISKYIMKQLLIGISYLHTNGIIHTDIKPENILLSSKISQLTTDFTIKIADFGSSTHKNNLFHYTVGTMGYQAPELTVEIPYTPQADIWSAVIVLYEMITGDYMFDIYNECGVDYGGEIEEIFKEYDFVYNAACGEEEDSSDEKMESSDEKMEPSDENSTDSTDDSSNGTYESDYVYFALITRLLGHPPEEFARNARLYFDYKNRLKDHPELSQISIAELLTFNYDIPGDECLRIQEFISLGLQWLPRDRASAAYMLSHPFMNHL